MVIYVFLSKILEGLAYWNLDDNAKNLKTRNIIYKKVCHYNVIINEKIFYDQQIDSDIKRYVEIRKSATSQSEGYTDGFLLDFGYIKNYYKLIAVDLITRK